jgi:quercetin dioxygenase-like cupin family protein
MPLEGKALAIILVMVKPALMKGEPTLGGYRPSRGHREGWYRAPVKVVRYALAGMERRRLAELIAFDERRMAKYRVFETDRTLTDLYCLDPGQEQLLHVHEGSDKVLLVLAGRVLVRVDDDTAEAGQYEAVLAPAGTKHAIKNLGPDPAVLLVFVGPRLA